MASRNPRGMYISKETLREHFDPRESRRRETYLLCELQWGNSENFWKHWVSNSTTCHAEECFVEEIFEPRSYKLCDITWYLSWSPCAKCCYTIQDFLESHPNVNIDIRAARLYFADDPETRQGLRDLASLPGVNIDIMSIEDYTYCWETFLQQGVYFLPLNFQRAITRNYLRLTNILEDLHL